jgi:hypothetical protein
MRRRIRAKLIQAKLASQQIHGDKFVLSVGRWQLASFA